jgi:HSP20 family protein
MGRDLPEETQMRRMTPTLPSSDLGHLAEDIRRLFEDLDRTVRGVGGYSSSECTPPLDVFETDRALEVRMDVPGILPESLRVMFKHGVLLIAGVKAPTPGASPGSATYHLVEREFGRFARPVRLTGALDVARARARLINGELRVFVPKLSERRGQELRISVEIDPAEPGV